MAKEDEMLKVPNSLEQKVIKIESLQVGHRIFDQPHLRELQRLGIL